MLNERANIFPVEGVHDREEVVTTWESAFGYGIRHEPHKLWHILHVGPEVLYGQLIVVWDLDHLDITQGHE